MINLLRKFLYTYKTLAPVFSKGKTLRALMLGKYAAKTAGGNLSLAYFSWRIIKMVFQRYVLMQLALVVLSIFSGVILLGLNTCLSGVGLDQYSDYLPSRDSFFKVISFVWVLTSAWIGVVVLNHWNDLISIFQSLDTDFVSQLAGSLALLWVITINMGHQFLTTLWINPSGLFETALVQEFPLFANSLRAIGLSIWDCIYYTPLEPVLIPVKIFISDCFNGLMNFMWTWSTYGWNSFITAIQNVITPDLKLDSLNELARKVTYPMASLFGVWIIWLIIRILFGL